MATEYYEDGMLKLSFSDSREWANELCLETIVDEVRDTVYIFTVKFSAIRFLNGHP